MQLRVWTFALAMTLSAGTAMADLQYGFDADSQGWTLRGSGNLSHAVNGGNPGGYLDFQDGSDLDEMEAVLPAAGLGDWTGYLGGILSFDAMNLSGDTSDWTPFGTVTLTGSAGTISLDIGADGQPAADAGWTRFSTKLDTATWGAELPTVLANVTDATVLVDFHYGATERVGFDNFAVTAVPEPATWITLAVGLGTIGVAARRRRSLG